ncbi:hypothetical protein IE53DRAFT_386109 [Violaceomyces palustris]|uniref:Uncharacterized protein n=1 Tax=Violaceomyces palustris TaxID=1673888 RepID=A0ACD0P077_9BASI|nr:hypothetical protein IE53DRAFT_386109 [Violaceomyces palustris]
MERKNDSGEVWYGTSSASLGSQPRPAKSRVEVIKLLVACGRISAQFQELQRHPSARPSRPPILHLMPFRLPLPLPLNPTSPLPHPISSGQTLLDQLSLATLGVHPTTSLRSPSPSLPTRLISSPASHSHSNLDLIFPRLDSNHEHLKRRWRLPFRHPLRQVHKS